MMKATAFGEESYFAFSYGCDGVELAAADEVKKNG